MKVPSISKLFDHSILRPNATRDEVLKFAQTAVQLDTATLCVQPCYIRLAAEALKGSDVLVCTVIGFPHGCETPSMKEFQAREVLDLGAQEIDMVMNIPALRNGDHVAFAADIEGVVRAGDGVKVKVILENCLLTTAEKRLACEWIAQAGAAFVKTSTGYATDGATLEDVRLMAAAVAGKCQVKAAGGVKAIDEVLAFLRAGATRFGSTRSDHIIQGFHDLPAEKKAEFGEFVMNLG